MIDQLARSRFLSALALAIALEASVLQAGFIHNPTNGHDYLVVPSGSPGTATWLEAYAAAQTYSFGGISGHLVTVTDAAEQSFLIDLIAPYRRGGTLATTDSFWIGGYATGVSTFHEPFGFAWVTGEPFTYQFNPFISGNEAYLEMYNVGPPDYPAEVFGNWNDIPNAGQGFLYGNGFIVEVDSVSAVPEPASLTLFGLGALGLAVRARRCGRGSRLRTESMDSRIT